ncbi:MAG: phosphoglycerate mutase family protein, partial [Candidatus Nanoarchaeia archaeon]
TTYNRDGIFTGWKDARLTKKGFKQANQIAKQLKKKKFQAGFYTSLTRSWQTLKPVIKHHPECVFLIRDDRMIERSYGDLEGMSHKQFIEEVGKKDIKFLKEKGDALENLAPKLKEQLENMLGKAEYKAIHRGYKIRPLNGESFKDVEKRVKSFIKDLKRFMRKTNINVAISAHGNSIRLFRKVMERLSKRETEQLEIPYDKYFEYDV